MYTREEVDKLSIGINSDDTESCLEEAPPMTDASGGQLDSSATLVEMLIMGYSATLPAVLLHAAELSFSVSILSPVMSPC